MPPKFSFLKYMRQNCLPQEVKTNFVCQDIIYKLDILKDALKFIDNETKIYPIWLCPAKAMDTG